MGFRRRKAEQGETNYLVSTSDLMAGLLFIFIIALALQIISFNEEERRALDAEAAARAAQAAAQKAEAEAREARAKANQAEEEARLARLKANKAESKAEEIQNRLAGNDIARRDLLLRMQLKLREEGLLVTVDPSNGVLRLPEEEITFETGKASVSETYAVRLRMLRNSLVNELRCFHSRSELELGCKVINPYSHTLDAVFIEGHTDNQPFGGDTTGRRNRTLSTERANTVYSILLDPNSPLHHYLNPKGQNLFSLSGYGSERPVPGHYHMRPTNDPVNRRIELRFLMSTPSLEAVRND